MDITWSDSFDHYIDRLDEEPSTSQEQQMLAAVLDDINNLKEPPKEESSHLCRAVGAKKHDIWRVSHPYNPEVAVRVLIWFTPNGDAVLLAGGGDKLKDRYDGQWYQFAIPQAEQEVDNFLNKYKAP